jgi:hypothetical protein
LRTRGKRWVNFDADHPSNGAKIPRRGTFGAQLALYTGSNASIGVLHDNADHELMQRIVAANRTAGMAGSQSEYGRSGPRGCIDNLFRELLPSRYSPLNTYDVYD